LGASLAWGISDSWAAWSAERWETARVLFWAQVGGLLAIGIAVAIRGQGPAGWAVLFAVFASIGGMLGALSTLLRGIQQGISVVAPIAGSPAIVPVIFGIATGDSPSALQLTGIACALLGVAPGVDRAPRGSQRVAAGAGLALLAAAGFGFYFPGCTRRARSTSGGLTRLSARSRCSSSQPWSHSKRAPMELGKRDLAIVFANRDRRHDRQRALRRLVGKGSSA